MLGLHPAVGVQPVLAMIRREMRGKDVWGLLGGEALVRQKPQEKPRVRQTINDNPQ